MLTRSLRIRENTHFVNAFGKAMAFLRGNFPLYGFLELDCFVILVSILSGMSQEREGL